MKELYEGVSKLPHSPSDKTLLTSSYSAYQASQPSPEERRTASLLSGDIVSDSESDNATDYAELHSLASVRVHRIVKKQRKALSRKNR